MLNLDMLLIIQIKTEWQRNTLLVPVSKKHATAISGPRNTVSKNTQRLYGTGQSGNSGEYWPNGATVALAGNHAAGGGAREGAPTGTRNPENGSGNGRETPICPGSLDRGFGDGDGAWAGAPGCTWAGVYKVSRTATFTTPPGAIHIGSNDTLLHHTRNETSETSEAAPLLYCEPMPALTGRTTQIVTNLYPDYRRHNTLLNRDGDGDVPLETGRRLLGAIPRYSRKQPLSKAFRIYQVHCPNTPWTHEPTTTDERKVVRSIRQKLWNCGVGCIAFATTARAHVEHLHWNLAHTLL